MKMKRRQTAINALTNYGESALMTLEEILSISAYEEIKAAWIVAIKSIREREKGKENAEEKRSDNENDNSENENHVDADVDVDLAKSII